MTLYVDTNAAMLFAASNPMTPQQRLDFLAAAVRLYLDRPGCNIPARQTALARLRWAVEQATAPDEIQAGQDRDAARADPPG